jgi:tRNA pseudouridine38-40 synthase
MTKTKMSIAVLFAYDGHDFDGLERLNSFLLRNNGENSIEHFLFKAIAAQYPEGTPIQMTHISRAATTHERENASKQVISLNLTGAPELPNVMAMNKLLPDSIRVFKVMQVDEDFSARRTCEARTVEYLIPVF